MSLKFFLKSITDLDNVDLSLVKKFYTYILKNIFLLPFLSHKSVHSFYNPDIWELTKALKSNIRHEADPFEQPLLSLRRASIRVTSISPFGNISHSSE